MRSIITFSLFVLMCSVSCDSFANPEIQKIKAEVERQNIEKEAVKQQAVKKAKKLFDSESEKTLEQFFFTHEVAVFKDKRTGVCLPMLYDNRLKDWISFGMLKNSLLSVKYSSGTYGGGVNFNNLKNLVKNHCGAENEGVNN